VLALHENPTNQACVVSCEIKGLLGSVFADAQKALEARLKKTSVADLLADARSGPEALPSSNTVLPRSFL
jgi:hypothetical protein